MEKILRKVSCKDRLPKEAEEYFVLMPSTSKRLLYFLKENAGGVWYSTANELKLPEYWYEEVDVCELEDYKVMEWTLQTALALDTIAAKERYEKSVNFLQNLSYMVVGMSDIKKALKIASGIE